MPLKTSTPSSTTGAVDDLHLGSLPSTPGCCLSTDPAIFGLHPSRVARGNSRKDGISGFLKTRLHRRGSQTPHMQQGSASTDTWIFIFFCPTSPFWLEGW
jgi:hypothetical protein